MSDQILTIEDLANRWHVETKEAIKVCRHQGVPFIQMRVNPMRVNWHKVRFRLDAIEAWERDKTLYFKQAAKPEPKPKTLAPPKRKRLGNY